MHLKLNPVKAANGKHKCSAADSSKKKNKKAKPKRLGQMPQSELKS